jgi:hypothetical protein
MVIPGRPRTSSIASAARVLPRGAAERPVRRAVERDRVRAAPSLASRPRPRVAPASAACAASSREARPSTRAADRRSLSRQCRQTRARCHPSCKGSVGMRQRSRVLNNRSGPENRRRTELRGNHGRWSATDATSRANARTVCPRAARRFPPVSAAWRRARPDNRVVGSGDATKPSTRRAQRLPPVARRVMPLS